MQVICKQLITFLFSVEFALSDMFLIRVDVRNKCHVFSHLMWIIIMTRIAGVIVVVGKYNHNFIMMLSPLCVPSRWWHIKVVEAEIQKCTCVHRRSAASTFSSPILHTMLREKLLCSFLALIGYSLEKTCHWTLTKLDTNFVEIPWEALNLELCNITQVTGELDINLARQKTEKQNQETEVIQWKLGSRRLWTRDMQLEFVVSYDMHCTLSGAPQCKSRPLQ